jgi:hypothetical protein
LLVKSLSACKVTYPAVELLRHLPLPPRRAARSAAPRPPPLPFPPPTPTPRTNRTRRVPHPVLIGHAASLTPYGHRPVAASRFTKRGARRSLLPGHGSWGDRRTAAPHDAPTAAAIAPRPTRTHWTDQRRPAVRGGGGVAALQDGGDWRTKRAAAHKPGAAGDGGRVGGWPPVVTPTAENMMSSAAAVAAAAHACTISGPTCPERGGRGQPLD